MKSFADFFVGLRFSMFTIDEHWKNFWLMRCARAKSMTFTESLTNATDCTFSLLGSTRSTI